MPRRIISNRRNRQVSAATPPELRRALDNVQDAERTWQELDIAPEDVWEHEIAGWLAGASPPVLEHYVPTFAGQTVFTTMQDVRIASPVLFYVNGTLYTRGGGHIVVSGAGYRTITWQPPAAGFQLATDDRVDIVYWAV